MAALFKYLRCVARNGLLAVFLSGAVIATTEADTARLVVHPDRLGLTGQDPEHGLIVTRIDAAGHCRDVTAESRFTSNSAKVVSVNSAGHCRAHHDGEAEIEVAAGDDVARVAVMVQGTAPPGAPSFRQDILPILTKAGCNAGGCHGKLAGQNGFRLSLRGYAPEWDYDWVTREVRGRRINAAFPEASLLVLKPTGGVVHEGGTRFKPGSRFYQTLVNWIAARAPGPSPEESDAARLVLPGDREMRPGEKQQLLIRAHYADGRVRDVTWLAQFFANDETVVSVKPSGLVKALRPGETSVRVHFQGQVEVVRFTMPFATQIAAADFEPRQNIIDEPVFKKLQALKIPPSPLSDDQTFLRRAFLDTIGALPKPEEVTAFLADTAPDKRRRLVDQLLDRPEWIDYWTLQFADLLQNRKERDHDVRGTKGVRAFHAWLRSQLAENRPWAQIARAVLLAKGDSTANPAVGYYLTVVGEKRNVEESELPDSVAQSFLGTRIGCARCHNHPLEKYTQDDFYHFAAFFSKVALKRESPESGPSILSTNGKEEQEIQKRIAELVARVVLSPRAQAAFDISREDPKVRDEYGRTELGQSCLMARRLVEGGVRFVTVNNGGWDHHKKIFEGLEKKVPDFDRAFSALIRDLDQRGLLAETLVVAMGEFGRTPKVNKDAGRDHWGRAGSMLFAGAGVQQGKVIGATDKNGAFVIERPVRPADVCWTIYEALGIDPRKDLHTPEGRPVSILAEGSTIQELYS